MEQQKSDKSNNKNINPKIRSRKIGHRKLLGELLLDFAKNTTLHGLRYVTERGLSLVEKIFWIITFMLSLVICMILMHGVWVNWPANDAFVTFSERLTHVSEVPFPAVTICPFSKIDQRLYNFNKSYFEFVEKLDLAYNKSPEWNISDIDFDEAFINDLTRISLICNGFTGLSITLMNHFFHHKYDDDDHKTVKKIIEVAPKLNDIFFLAEWHVPLEIWTDPYDIFDAVLTEEGVCFTFNSLAADEILKVEKIQTNYFYSNASTPRRSWSLDGGYSNSSHVTYPRRGQENGADPVVFFVLRESMIRDELCDGDQPGFKVYLHHPGDLPQTSLNYYTALPNKDNSFVISVDVRKSSKSLFRCPVHIRQCYFLGEKYLKYFRVYSQSNCQLECMSNFSLANCGCVWFNVPFKDNTVLCKFSARSQCLKPALEKYFTKEGKTIQCNCLPACSTIQYKAEVFRTRAKYLQFENNTHIKMFFKEPFLVSRVRECTGMFELTDFLAYCGGLLGLFLGFSFLSLVEILYFCTLRLGRMYKKSYRADNKQNIKHIKTI